MRNQMTISQKFQDLNNHTKESTILKLSKSLMLNTKIFLITIFRARHYSHSVEKGNAHQTL